MGVCKRFPSIMLLAFVNILFFWPEVLFSSEEAIVKKQAYGIIKRVNTSSAVVVIIPMSGIFKADDEVIVYEKDGNIVCNGKVKSIYTDEIFVNIDQKDISALRKGLIVAKNYSFVDVGLIDEDEYNDGLGTIEKYEKEAEQAYIDAKKQEEEKFRNYRSSEGNRTSTKRKIKPPVYYKHYNYESWWTKEEFHKYCKGCHQDWKRGPVKCDECHRK